MWCSFYAWNHVLKGEGKKEGQRGKKKKEKMKTEREKGEEKETDG